MHGRVPFEKASWRQPKRSTRRSTSKSSLTRAISKIDHNYGSGDSGISELDPHFECDASALEMKQLRCFVAVAEELHFGRAAIEMNMTQSPFSRQIQILERRLGVQLLDRGCRHVRLWGRSSRCWTGSATIPISL